MGAVRMVALVTVTAAVGEEVAPGGEFVVETEAEALRLEKIGAAARIRNLEDVLDERLTRPAAGVDDGEDPA